MTTKRWITVGAASCTLVVGCFVLVRVYVRAADGSGSIAVSPASVRAAATDTFVFTATSTETMSSGELAITVPSTWTTPQGVAGVAGYTTATSTNGMVADVLDTADSVSGWVAGTACSNGLTLDATTKHEGSSSIRCDTLNESIGDRWYTNVATQNWSSKDKVGFWIYATKAIANTRLKFAYDNDANIASPIEEINLGAIAQNTWTYVVVTFTSTRINRASVASYGLVIRHGTGLDNATIRIDDLLIGPGTPTFPGGGDIRVRLLQLATGQAVQVTYGANGGVSGATAPTTTGAYLFTAKTRVSDSGTLQPIGVSPSIQVTPAIATRFIIVLPGTGSAGTPLSVTVQALDPYGNVDDTYQNDVTLNASGSATGGGLMNIVNGVGTLMITDTVAETVHCSLTDSEGTGLDVASVQDVAFEAGAVARFTLNHPGDLVASQRLRYTVAREDSYGNPVINGSTIVYLYKSASGPNAAFYNAEIGGDVITSVTLGTGTSTGTVWYTDDEAGSVTVTASDNASSPDGASGIADAEDVFTVQPAAFAAVILSHPGDMVAGERNGFTVLREDAFGNQVTTGTATLYLYSDGAGANEAFYGTASGGTPIASVSFANGSSTMPFWYFDDKAGAVSLTVSDGTPIPNGSDGVSDAVDSFAVLASSTARFLLSDPGDMTIGTRIAYTVSREDAFANVVTAGSDTVYLYTNASGTAGFYDAAVEGSPLTQVTILPTQSTADFWYGDDTIGSHIITASDDATSPNGVTGIIDGTDVIAVNAAPIVPSRFVIYAPATGTAGTGVLVTVKVEDDAGNVDSTYSQDVDVRTSGSATGGGLVDITNGVGAITITDTVAETTRVSLFDSQGTGLQTDSFQDIAFAPGPTYRYRLNQPVDPIAGSRSAYVVSREDAYGNVVTAGSETISLYTTTPGGLAHFYNAPLAGSVMTSVDILDGQSNADVWYEDLHAGSVTVTASDNPVTPDAAGIIDATDALTVLAGSTATFLLNDPGDMTAGTRIGYTMTREDAYGNPATSGGDIAYLSSTASGTSTAFYDASTGGTPITSMSFPANASEASFWYAEETVGTWTVTASDNAANPDGAAGILDATDDVQVSAAPIAATRFVIRPVLGTTVGGTVQVTIRAEDPDGNVDTAYQQDVTLVLSGSATGGGLVDIVNGVGTSTISDATAETVPLTLADTEGTGLDVFSSQNVVFSAQGTSGTSGTPASVSTGGGATAGASIKTALRFIGQAYPGAELTLVGRTTSGERSLAKGKVTASDGSFQLEYAGSFQGITAYEVQVSDRDGRVATSTPMVIKVPVGEVTERRVIAAPTIGLVWFGVLRGIPFDVIGYALPQSDLEILLDGASVPGSVRTEANGSYRSSFDTIGMSLGGHTIAVRQKLANGSPGAVSASLRFTVLETLTPQADLNNDGKVDISDWSIFLSRWTSADAETKKQLDLNNDGKVDISDFSILIRSIRRHL